MNLLIEDGPVGPNHPPGWRALAAPKIDCNYLAKTTYYSQKPIAPRGLQPEIAAPRPAPAKNPGGAGALPAPRPEAGKIFLILGVFLKRKTQKWTVDPPAEGTHSEASRPRARASQHHPRTPNRTEAPKVATPAPGISSFSARAMGHAQRTPLSALNPGGIQGQFTTHARVRCKCTPWALVFCLPFPVDPPAHRAWLTPKKKRCGVATSGTPNDGLGDETEKEEARNKWC